MKTCSFCASSIPAQANFCADCGARQISESARLPDDAQTGDNSNASGEAKPELDTDELASELKSEANGFPEICSACGTDAATNWIFCDNCGAELRFSRPTEFKSLSANEKSGPSASGSKKIFVLVAAASVVGILSLWLGSFFSDQGSEGSASPSQASIQIDEELSASSEPAESEPALDLTETSPPSPEITREEKITQLLNSYLLNTSSTHSSPSNEELILKTTWVVNSRLDEENPELKIETIIKSASAVLGTQIDQVTFSGGEIVLITEVPSQWLGTTQLIQFEFSSEGVTASRQISHAFEFDPGSLAFSGIEELQTADWGTPLPGLEKVAANLARIGLCNKFQEFDGVSPEIPCIEDGQPNSSGYLFQTTDQLLGQATYPQIFYEDELVILGRGWGARFFDSNWTEGDLSKLRSIGAFAFRSNQIPCDIDLGEGVEIGLCYGR